MRETIIKGIEDGLSIKIVGNVSLICAVMKIGKAIDDLTFETKLSGEELLKLLNENKAGGEYNISEIVKENHYEVTAYDW